MSFFWFFSLRQLRGRKSQLLDLPDEADGDLQENLNGHRLSVPWNDLKLGVDSKLSGVLVDVSNDRLAVDDLEKGGKYG